MSQLTENFGLEKPDENEYLGIQVINNNMDKIDTAIAAAANNETTTRIDANVTDIKGKIGATTDTGGTTTAGGIFAKLNAILQQFLSNWTVARAVKLDNLDVAVSSRASAEDLKKINSNLVKPLDNLIENKVSGISSWFGDTNNLIHTLKAGTIPIVKSVQRGMFNDSYPDAGGQEKYAIISGVNPNKSVLTLYSNSMESTQPRGKMLDGTHLALYPNEKGAGGQIYYKYIWEVVEFY